MVRLLPADLKLTLTLVYLYLMTLTDNKQRSVRSEFTNKNVFVEPLNKSDYEMHGISPIEENSCFGGRNFLNSLKSCAISPKKDKNKVEAFDLEILKELEIFWTNEDRMAVQNQTSTTNDARWLTDSVNLTIYYYYFFITINI